MTLTFEIRQEEGYFLAECLELGVPSFGDSLEGALQRVGEATTLYLNTLEAIGEAK